LSDFSLIRILEVGTGGALGCLLRFVLTTLVKYVLDKKKDTDVLSFPHHTLLVNVLGCFIMGLLSVILVHPSPLASTALDAFFLIGFCGGLTTFSSFMLDTVNHFRVRQYFYVIGYLVITVCFCLIADFIGRVLAHHWFI
jgi:fluoride exporter